MGSEMCIRDSTHVEQVSASPGDLVIERVENSERTIEHSGFVPLILSDERIAAGNLIVADTAQIDRGSVSGTHLGALGVETLHGTYAHGLVLWQKHKFVVDADSSPGERAGHNSARPFRGECSIDPKPRRSPVDRIGSPLEEQVEFGEQRVDPGTVEGVDRHDWGALEEGAFYPFFDVEDGELDEILVGEADLGKRHNSVAYPEQIEDSKVFLGLGLPALVGIDDEETCVDGAHTSQHVLQKADVALSLIHI